MHLLVDGDGLLPDDITGNTDLHWAGRLNWELDHVGPDGGKSIRDQAYYKEAINENGHRPMHTAMQGANAEMVAWLLGQGARLNVTDTAGNTPLSMLGTATNPRPGQTTQTMVQATVDVVCEHFVRKWAIPLFRMRKERLRAAMMSLMTRGAMGEYRTADLPEDIQRKLKSFFKDAVRSGTHGGAYPGAMLWVASTGAMLTVLLATLGS